MSTAKFHVSPLSFTEMLFNVDHQISHCSERRQQQQQQERTAPLLQPFGHCPSRMFNNVSRIVCHILTNRRTPRGAAVRFQPISQPRNLQPWNNVLNNRIDGNEMTSNQNMTSDATNKPTTFHCDNLHSSLFETSKRNTASTPTNRLTN